MKRYLLTLLLVAALCSAATLVLGQTSVIGTRSADEEVLGGPRDGVNQVFTLRHTPYPWLSLKVYYNGLRLTRCRDGATTGCDYTLISPYNQIRLVDLFKPTASHILIADYKW